MGMCQFCEGGGLVRDRGRSKDAVNLQQKRRSGADRLWKDFVRLAPGFSLLGLFRRAGLGLLLGLEGAGAFHQ